MKKYLSVLGVFAVMFALFAFGTEARAATPWDVTGSYVISLESNSIYYTEYLVLVQSDDDITGTSLALGGGASPWTIDDGTVSGNTIEFFGYFNSNPSMRVRLEGTIDSDGSISGTWNDVSPGTRTGTWETTSGTAIKPDPDHDGVLGDGDYCPGTIADAWDVDWGTNRLEVRDTGGHLAWWQNKPGKKGALIPTEVHDLEYTYGCNGHQILALLYEELGSVMNGHHKFGLSSSVVEDFHKDLEDGVLDGRYFVETVPVPATDAVPTPSLTFLDAGKDYVLKAYGTAYACNQPGCVIPFDAEYSTSDGGVNWVDGVAAPYDSYGVDLLDLMVDGGYVDWGVFSSAHTYELPYVGTGNPLGLMVYDVDYPSNSGSLYVDIFAQIN